MFLFVLYYCLEFFWINYHFIVFKPIDNNFQLGLKIFFNSATVFEMTDKELSSAKLYIDALETKKKKSYIEKIKKDWSCYVALGDSRDCLLNHSVYHLYDYIDFGL